ncbi:MAG: gamma-glutamyltransferase [Dehalococcoidia bacterium]
MLNHERQTPRTWRPVIMGRGGAVASNHPLATLAGYEALRAGGNAADAAVAVAATLGVVEPYMSGMGGDGFYLVYEAAKRKATLVNASGPAPQGATAARFASGIPQYGILSASVPCAVDGWLTLQSRFGSRSLPELLAPAIERAREGFGATRHFCDFAGQQQTLLSRDPGCSRTYLRDGRVPPIGTLIRNPELARTLEAVAVGRRDAFYGGETAREFARFNREAGGLTGETDLAGCRVEIQEPISTTYRGYTVLNAPPNSMGFTLLQELNIVENVDLAGMGFCSAALIHTLVEAKKLAFFDRERYAGDPRFTQVPLDRLLDKGYARQLAGRIDPRRASTGAPVPVEAGDTTYFAVIDGQGNAVSGIQSLGNLFGSGVMAGSTGVLLNNRMHTWHLEPGHPNQLQPGKRVRHTMNTPMALQDGEVRALCGTPGGDTQVQVNLQTFTGMLDLGLDPQQAVEMPRWENFQDGTHTSWPHTHVDELTVEDRLPPEVIEDLRARGHAVQVLGALEGPCSAEIILRDPATGLLMAGSDPRRDGYAMAF